MKAIFTMQLWAEVEDVDEASATAVEMDKSARLAASQALERRGAGEDDVRGHVGLLGTSFWLLDEELTGIEEL